MHVPRRRNGERDAANGRRFSGGRSLRFGIAGGTIGDVIARTVDEARLFSERVAIVRSLKPAWESGGILPLGQTTAPLSGGAAQSLKSRSSSRSRPAAARGVLFLCDEPTRGLTPGRRSPFGTFHAHFLRGHSIVAIGAPPRLSRAPTGSRPLPGGARPAGQIVAEGRPRGSRSARA